MSKNSIGAFHTILPWNFITKYHDGVVIQKDGIMQRTFAYRAPDADSSDSQEIEELSLRVNDFARRLGGGWSFFIEAQRFCTKEYPKEERGKTIGFTALAPYIIEREREEEFQKPDRHFESSYYLTFTWKALTSGAKKLTSLFVQSAKGGDEDKSIKENVEYFVKETDALVALLGNNLMIAPLDNNQTLEYLRSSISFNRHPMHFPYTQIFLDRILPDSELVNTLTMKLGDYYIPIIGVNDFPEETYPAMFERLNRLRLEYRWSIRYICLSKEEGKKEAQKKEKSHRGSRKTFLQSFAESTSSDGASGNQTYNHSAGIKEEDSIMAGIEIDTDVAALGYYSCNVMVWDRNYEKAIYKSELVRNIINTAGFSCKEERYNALEAFKSMMPGQNFANYRSLPIMTYNLSHIVPLSSVWSGMRVNVHAGYVTGVDLPHITCSTQEGTPFYFSLNPGTSDVGHAAIWGPTGAGKSTLLNLLEAQFYRYTASQIIVFDKGRSCRQICLASGGLFYEPAAESAAGVSFQPLRELETERDIQDAMDFIEACIVVSGNDVSPSLRTAIRDSLDLLRGLSKQQRTMTSFIQYCSYSDPVTKQPVLKDWLGDYLYAGGKYGKIFDQEVTLFSTDTRFLAIEMEEMMNRGEGCVVPALVFLFNMIDKKFDGRLTLLILDEAWIFLKNPVFSQKIAEWLKVLRKKNVFVVFATQDVADVANSPIKTTIIQQCLTKIFLADPNSVSAGMIDVYRAFGLTDTEIGHIAGATMKRDYFYTSPLGRRMFQLDLGQVTLCLIGAPKHSLLDKLIYEKGAGVPLCRDILDSYNINYQRFVDDSAPVDYQPSREETISFIPPKALPPREADEGENEISEEFTTSNGENSSKAVFKKTVDAAMIFETIDEMRKIKRKKGEGKLSELIAEKLSVSCSTVDQAIKILKSENHELISAVKNNEITIVKAASRLREKI